MDVALDALRFGGSAAACRCSCRPRRAECGLASLAMIAASTAIASTSRALRRRFTVSLKGATLADLMQRRRPAAPRAAAAARSSSSELPQLRAPCILHWDLNHFVVLKEIGRRRRGDPRSRVRRAAAADGRGLAALHRHRARALAHRRVPAGATSAPRAACAHLLGPGERAQALAGAGLRARAGAPGVRAADARSTCSGWSTASLVSDDRDLLVTLGLGFLLLVLMQVGARRCARGSVLLPAAHAQPAVAGERVRAPAAPAGELLREAPPRRRGLALRRRAAPSSARSPRASSRRCSTALMAVVTLAMMLVYSGALTAIALAGVAALRPAALAFFRAAAARDRGAHRASRQAAEPLPRDRARRAVDQALRPPGGAALALAEPGGRRGEPRPRDAEARPGVRRPAQRPRVRRRARGGRLARRAAGARHAFSVGMLFAFVAYKEQFAARVGGPDRQADRAAHAAPAGRAPGRHRADRARGRSPTASRRSASVDAIARGARTLGFAYSRQPSRSCCVGLLVRGRAGRVGRDRRSVGRRQDHAAQAACWACSRPPTARSAIGGVDIQKLGIDRYRKHGRHRDAGRPALRRLDRRQHQLLRSRRPTTRRSSTARASPPCTTTSPRCRWATTR